MLFYKHTTPRNKNMKKNALFFLIGCLTLASSCKNKSSETVTNEVIETQEEIEIKYEYGIPIDSFNIEEGVVQQGQTLSGLFSQLGATANVINQLPTLSDTLLDVRKFRAGNEYLAFYTKDTIAPRLEYFVYKQSVINSVVLHLTDSIHAEKQQKEVTAQARVSEAKITSSLWNAITDNNLNIQLALDLSDIYAWTVDFFGLQVNDGFTVYYDELYVDSISVGIGKIYAASFQNAGKTIYAFNFEKDDLSGFFDEDGNSLKKAFLKAPLNFKRISSHFTYARKHPIFKTVRPHTGVDYAAPAGTPVVSIGDGVVIEKGYKGGGGNTVKIKHNSMYTTAYLHLSKYGNIQVGKRVKQGEVIGYVGSTGNSTGPHLDFRVWKGGTPVNPLTMEAPPVEPVPEKYKAEFDSVKVALLEKLTINKSL